MNRVASIERLEVAAKIHKRCLESMVSRGMKNLDDRPMVMDLSVRDDTKLDLPDMDSGAQSSAELEDEDEAAARVRYSEWRNDPTRKLNARSSKRSPVKAAVNETTPLTIVQESGSH
jgi:hypothetical protein